MKFGLVEKVVTACEAALQREAERRARREAFDYYRQLEEMCERALVDPAGRGVLVLENQDGTYAMMLDESVPYGTIHRRKETAWDER